MNGGGEGSGIQGESLLLQSDHNAVPQLFKIRDVDVITR
jgi:hypothetical protein